MLERITVIRCSTWDPRAVGGSGVEVRCEDPFKMTTLRNAGVEQAAIVVCLSVPGTDTPGSLPAIVHRVRSLSRRVRVLAGPEAA